MSPLSERSLGIMMCATVALGQVIREGVRYANGLLAGKTFTPDQMGCLGYLVDREAFFWDYDTITPLEVDEALSRLEAACRATAQQVKP